MRGRVNRQASARVVIALESLLLVFAVYAWFFAVAWLFALLRRAVASAACLFSFASAGPPLSSFRPGNPSNGFPFPSLPGRCMFEPSKNPLVKWSLAAAIFWGRCLPPRPSLARNGGVVSCRLPA